MKHVFNQKVFYSDTDAYGVVWHGSYLRWLEMGRIGLCEMTGYPLSVLTLQDIILPVSEINVKYKSPAKLEDEMIIETEVFEFNKFYMVFAQSIKSATSNVKYIEAKVKVVAINNEGKLYRKLPDIMLEICGKCNDKN